MIRYELLPEGLRGGAHRYIEHHIIPGSFLQAVISNDLVGSFGLADDDNVKRLWDIVNFFYNEAPSPCWGSKEKMLAWLERKTEKEQTEGVLVAKRIKKQLDNMYEKTKSVTFQDEILAGDVKEATE